MIENLCSLFQEVDSMRSAYYSDLCSKFMIENTILKMEYAEVRVFSISDKVSPSQMVNLEWSSPQQVLMFLSLSHF